MKNYRKILGLLSGMLAIAMLIIPIFFYGNLNEITQSTGYLGYFLATYFGFGMYTLPWLIKILNPFLLTLIGAFGFTIDEFFAWYAGSVSEELDHSNKFHKKIQSYVEQYGLLAIFMFGLLPLPGVVYAISGFAAGHFRIPFYKFFLTNFSAKLIRTAVIVIGLLVFF